MLGNDQLDFATMKRQQFINHEVEEGDYKYNHFFNRGEPIVITLPASVLFDHHVRGGWHVTQSDVNAYKAHLEEKERRSRAPWDADADRRASFHYGFYESYQPWE